MTHQMTYHSDKQIFIRFLKENNLYASFKTNFKSNNLSYLKDWHESEYNDILSGKGNYFEVINPKNYIQYAFTWNRSKEGDVFWVAKDNEWRKVLSYYHNQE